MVFGAFKCWILLRGKEHFDFVLDFAKLTQFLNKSTPSTFAQGQEMTEHQQIRQL
jgi:hypothetical protein